MISVILGLVALAAAPSVESVLQRMAALTIPDTADYRTTTTVQLSMLTTRVSTHVIQAGPKARWMEMDASGRRSRTVTSGGRTVVTDLATNKSVQIPAMEGSDNPGAALSRYLASRWKEPVSRGDGLWEMIQGAAEDSAIVHRSLMWDETAGEIRSLVQIGKSGDTTRLEFAWIRTGGHVVPSSMKIIQSLPSQSIRTEMVFSDWKFPRSIPSNLFAVP